MTVVEASSLRRLGMLQWAHRATMSMSPTTCAASGHGKVGSEGCLFDLLSVRVIRSQYDSFLVLRDLAR